MIKFLLWTYLRLKSSFKNNKEKMKWINSTIYKNLSVYMSPTQAITNFKINNWRNACRECTQGLMSKELKWKGKKKGTKNEKNE